MKRQAVQSGNIKSVGYDNAAKTLEVEFRNGSVYRYPNISQEQHQRLMSADSLGRHFHQYLRHFRAEKEK